LGSVGSVAGFGPTGCVVIVFLLGSGERWVAVVPTGAAGMRRLGAGHDAAPVRVGTACQPSRAVPQSVVFGLVTAGLATAELGARSQ